jgi:hypothetical protein
MARFVGTLVLAVVMGIAACSNDTFEPPHSRNTAQRLGGDEKSIDVMMTLTEPIEVYVPSIPRWEYHYKIFVEPESGVDLNRIHSVITFNRSQYFLWGHTFSNGDPSGYIFDWATDERLNPTAVMDTFSVTAFADLSVTICGIDDEAPKTEVGFVIATLDPDADPPNVAWSTTSTTARKCDGSYAVLGFKTE